jgi:hypothetical protein
MDMSEMNPERTQTAVSPMGEGKKICQNGVDVEDNECIKGIQTGIKIWMRFALPISNVSTRGMEPGQARLSSSPIMEY